MRVFFSWRDECHLWEHIYTRRIGFINFVMRVLGGEKKGNRENYEENGNAHDVSERKRENMWKKDKRWKGV